MREMIRLFAPSLAMTAAACAVPLALLLWLGHRTVDLDGDQHFMIVVIAALGGGRGARPSSWAPARGSGAVITAAPSGDGLPPGRARRRDPGAAGGDNSLIASPAGARLRPAWCAAGGRPLGAAPGPSARCGAARAAAVACCWRRRWDGEPDSVRAVPAQGSDEAPLAVAVGIVLPGGGGDPRGDDRPADPPPRDLCVLLGLGDPGDRLVAEYGQTRWAKGGLLDGHGTAAARGPPGGGPVALDARTAVPACCSAATCAPWTWWRRRRLPRPPGARAPAPPGGERTLLTEGHTRRVALLAVQVGEELDLSAACAASRSAACCTTSASCGARRDPEEAVARAHDAEFAVVRRHPGWGAALLEEPGFGPRSAIGARPPRATRRHGYPSRKIGPQLSDEAMIVAVCDVYDGFPPRRVP